ncbi:MAG: HAMP domain-containing sensor histidine kinase [Cyanobacteriota/Melainabacteria group bacterium]
MQRSSTLTAVAYSLVGIIVVANLLVLCGWLSGIDWLKNPIPGQIPVAPTTAACFILTTVNFHLLASRDNGTETIPRLDWIITTVAVMTALVALLILGINYLPDITRDLEQALFNFKLEAIDHFAPGRMSPSTALYFLLLSIATLLFDFNRRFPWAQLIILATLFLSLLNLVGYLYGLPELCGLGAFTRIAAPTALGFILLGLALLMIRPKQRVSHLLANDTTGGVTARTILPVALICPITLGWIGFLGREYGLWNWSFAAAFMVVASIFVFCIVLAALSCKLERMDRERSRILREREDLATQRDTFMAVLTHDLKNPLIGAERVLGGLISGATGELTEEQINALSMVKRSNDDLLSMVKTLLQLYKFDRNTEVLHFEETGIEKSIMEAVEEMEPLAGNHGIELKCNISSALPPVRIDRNAMTHVLTNLIQNAIKFSNKDSIVEISADNLDELFCQIKIHDNGPGIPEKILPHLFERYNQGETGKHYKTGTGLGLFLCNQIVQAHQGKLTCTSKEDSGTTFSILLKSATEHKNDLSDNGAEKENFRFNLIEPN